MSNNKYIFLIWIQIKSAFNNIPKMIVTMAVFAMAVILLGVCGTKMMAEKGKSEKYNIAIVLPEDGEQYTKVAFDFLGEIDTVKNVCTFIQMDKESAYAGLRDGSIFSIILVPDSFVEHIVDGTNVPAHIILPRSGFNSQSGLFRELVEAGSTDLSAAQAGIYAVDDIMSELGIDNGVAEAEAFLNKEYFSYALDRSSYFRVIRVAATGDLSIIQFYICSGIAGLLMLCGIPAYELLKRDNISVNMAMRRQNIPISLLSFAKILGVTIVYYVICIVAYLVLLLLGIRMDNVAAILPPINLVAAVGVFTMLFSMYSFVHLVYNLTNHQLSGTLVLFMAIAILLFASGAVIPEVLLPNMVQQLAQFLPTTYYLRMVKQTMIANTDVKVIGINLAFAIAFIGVSTVAEYIRAGGKSKA